MLKRANVMIIREQQHKDEERFDALQSAIVSMVFDAFTNSFECEVS